ncbi:MAG: ABC transporter permease [Planctomycetota bacterium]|jgi:branched-chain amino acid transport system permease protein|nr:ABC transporter permease [Planctomycetota bacterium]
MNNRFVRLFTGPQSLGTSGLFWCCFLAATVLMFCLPWIVSEYELGNITYFLSNIFLALGLSMMWGCGGILSFGQMAFFGLGGYSYGIIALNLMSHVENTFAAAAGSVLISVLGAAILGYFLFYGRVSGVYVTIITLVATLIFETFMAQTAGPKWAIGKALLGGYNGMVGIPGLQWSFGDGVPYVLQDAALFFFTLALLLIVYMFLRWLVNSPYGNALVATGSSPLRTEMLGYDIRWIQLIAFSLAGGLAGVSGVLYVAWGRYITPSTMGLTTAALPVIWVAIGGRKSLLAAMISAISLQYFSQYLSASGSQYALVIQGGLLMLAIMFVPEGLIPPVGRFIGKAWRRAGGSVPMAREERM